jgi:hypothetical protein
MRDTITQIQALLSQLQGEVSQAEQVSESRALPRLDLQDICDVVDLLMPELKPYEVAFYLYFLRHSICDTGEPYFTVSRRGLQSGVFRSARREEKRNGDSGKLSYAAVQEAVNGLINHGAIRQEGEPTRRGTLYRIILPKDIEVCRQRRPQTENRPCKPASESEADFYNVPENRRKIYERDSYRCYGCYKQLTEHTATLDHLVAVKNGGNNSAENLATSCLQCNSKKNAGNLGDFLADSDSARRRLRRGAQLPGQVKGLRHH